jgi:hypothetical protein
MKSGLILLIVVVALVIAFRNTAAIRASWNMPQAGA